MPAGTHNQAQLVEAARAALAPGDAWIVGGSVRDELLGRETLDLDLAVDGDPEVLAKQLAGGVSGHAFELSGEFSTWRVALPQDDVFVDLTKLRADSIEADLHLRDFTINAIALPLHGGEAIDPLAGQQDIEQRTLRLVSGTSISDDPLRAVRLVRFAVELGFQVDSQAAAAARVGAPDVAGVAGERIFAELRKLICSSDPVVGVRLLDDLELLPIVLPELADLKGIAQSDYHHLDVFEHTLAALEWLLEIESDPVRWLGSEAAQVELCLHEPLADQLTRWQALRLGALLHDCAKPQTKTVYESGKIGFPGHDKLGAELSRDAMKRLRASSKLREYVAGLAEHHLRVGFLTHKQPISESEIFDYLAACEPIELDVTVLSLADRLATRGRNFEPAVECHTELAHALLGRALAWPAFRAQPPLVRGRELADQLGITPGPKLGQLLEAVAAARYAGEVGDAAGAVEFARARLTN